MERQLPIGLLLSWDTLEAITNSKGPKHPRKHFLYPSRSLCTKHPHSLLLVAHRPASL